jgi:hypothetical protein
LVTRNARARANVSLPQKRFTSFTPFTGDIQCPCRMRCTSLMLPFMAHDTRVRVVPDEYRAHARERMAELGVAAAARELGLSTSSLLRVIAGAPVMPGSLALLREAINRRVTA